MTDTYKPWANAFLAALQDGGIVSRAAAAAGCTVAQVASYRKSSPEFDAAFLEALEGAIDALEAEARRRALEGVAEPVYWQGEVVGTTQRYSDGLLQFLLKGRRRHVYGDKQEISGPNGGPIALDSTARAARVAQLIEAAQARRDADRKPEDFV